MKMFNVGIFFIDDYIWMIGMNGYVVFFVWVFDNYFGYGCLFEFFYQEFVNVEVFVEKIVVFVFVGVLVGVLGVVDFEVYVDWVNFVFYQVFFLILCMMMVRFENGFLIWLICLWVWVWKCLMIKVLLI